MEGDEDIVIDYRFKWRTVTPIGPAPEARCWHSSASTSRYIVASGGYSGFAYFGDLHIFDTHTKQWVVGVSDAIKPRYAHSTSAIDGSFYIFGGAKERIYYKTFCSFPIEPACYNARGSGPAPSTTAHAAIGQDVNPVGKIMGPTERAAHGTAVLGGKLWIFGGDAGKGIYHNDMHSFDPKTGCWTLHAATGQVPSVRGWCSLCPVDTRLYVLFGTNGNDVFNEVYCFDTENEKAHWSKIATNGPDPRPRHSHGAAVKGDVIFVFGGVSERKRQLINDVWVFMTATNTWVCATPSPGTQQPPARYGHSAVFVGQDLYIFGGCLLNSSGTRTYSNEILSFTFDMRPCLKGSPSTLSTDLKRLVNNKEMFSDITFVVEGKLVHAHRCILSTRNIDFFQRMLCGRLKESTADTITIPYLSHQVFLVLLEYLYTGAVQEIEYTGPLFLAGGLEIPDDVSLMSPDDGKLTPFQLAAEVLEAAHMYNMQPLVRICAQYLVGNMIPETVAGVWKLGCMYEIPSLRKVCIKFASVYQARVMASPLADVLSPEELEQFKADLLPASKKK